jgi:hypothetical protein
MRPPPVEQLSPKAAASESSPEPSGGGACPPVGQFHQMCGWSGLHKESSSKDGQPRAPALSRDPRSQRRAMEQLAEFKNGRTT